MTAPSSCWMGLPQQKSTQRRARKVPVPTNLSPLAKIENALLDGSLGARSPSCASTFTTPKTIHDSTQLLLDGIAPTKKARRKVPVPTNLCPRTFGLGCVDAQLGLRAPRGAF